MELQIDPTTLPLLRRARQLCQTRVVQLTTCRVCGENQAELEQAVKLLKDLERQLEVQDVQPVQP
jgi:hypothetical protein